MLSRKLTENEGEQKEPHTRIFIVNKNKPQWAWGQRTRGKINKDK